MQLSATSFPALACLVLLLVTQFVRTHAGLQCEPMSFQECSFNGANKWTIFPNMNGDQNMEDAVKQYNVFRSLLQFKCSPFLQQFLCFYMFPGCSNNDPTTSALVLHPCRSLCERVRFTCDQALRGITPYLGSLDTMPNIRCEGLPEKADDPNCIEAEVESATATATTFISVNHSAVAQRQSTCEATVLKAQNAYVPRCGADVLFNAETKRFADVWMTVWAVVCCVASFLTFITILRDKQRFIYPERPVMFLALCYFGYSTAYLVRAIAGPYAVSCERNEKSSCDMLVRDDIQPLCMVVFIVGYFFSLSAAFWWLMFTVGWLLSATAKWSPEAIEARSSYFHVFAWATPACLTSIVIALRKVEGDELMGMCLIGVSNELDLLLFQILPHAVLLLISIALLAAGFIASARIRNELAESYKLGTDKLEKLIVKVAVSAFFYIAPTLVILACTVYQYVNLPAWNAAVRRAGERQERRPVIDNPPLAELFIVKIFASFAVGISLLMWICSVKTLRSWQRCFSLSDAARDKRRHAEPRDAATRYAPLNVVATASPTANANSGSRSTHPSSSSASRGVQSTTNGENSPFLAVTTSPAMQFDGAAAYPLAVGPSSPSPHVITSTGTMSYLAGFSGDAAAARLASVHALPSQPYNLPVQPYRLDQPPARPVAAQYKNKPPI